MNRWELLAYERMQSGEMSADPLGKQPRGLVQLSSHLQRRDDGGPALWGVPSLPGGETRGVPHGPGKTHPLPLRLSRSRTGYGCPVSALWRQRVFWSDHGGAWSMPGLSWDGQ